MSSVNQLSSNLSPKKYTHLIVGNPPLPLGKFQGGRTKAETTCVDSKRHREDIYEQFLYLEHRSCDWANWDTVGGLSQESFI